VHSVLALDLVFVAIGLALAASTYETAFAVVVVVTDRAERDRCLLLLSMMTAFAAAFFYPLTGWLDQLLGWRGALVALAALMAVIAIPGHLWVVPNAATHRARVTRTLGRSIGDALRDRHFWLLSAAFVIEAGAGSAVTVQLVSFLRHEGHSAEVSATVPMLIGVLSVPIRLYLGTAGRRFGMVAVTAAAFAIQALGAGVLWFTARSIVWTAVSIAAFGFGVAVATLSRPAIFADRYGPARYAGIISVTALMIGVSRAVAPLAASTLGDGQFLLWASGASVLSAAMLMFAGRSRSEQETSDDKTTDAACEDIYS
jgi:predicted MFS family arabinose efflux permease